ncbi:MAG: 1-deoxy-D-xylulose-5-phosphate reductoisomerase [Prevotellaceae bacterium]|jgi:1-deoxy-D-xylulose-5-phosphate reductoisomerase|nr:1-deoxy-D-xylulose-5-phosphate reductoisomerase [Prevotellaceae bacterium]
MEKRRITILGSTGSIGIQTLEIIKRHAGLFEAEVLTAHRNAALLIEQALAFQPNAVVIADESKYRDVSEALAAYPVKVYAGEAALAEVAAWNTADIVVSALVGFAGLRPTLAALRAGKTVALANKETLVTAGALIADVVAKQKGTVIPVDSEHSAIFQCLAGEHDEAVALYLTASGGPFLNTAAAEFANITKAQALKHPNWNMGAKVTIDSATMMNKGLEVIEAHWLFGISADKIKVVVHPQSIVHSMVQFIDGSVKAQLSLPDMKLPIQYALGFPQRLPLPDAALDFSTAMTLEFFPPDMQKFRCLPLAYEALQRGGNIPCAMNAANEAAVAAFLAEKITFPHIPDIVETVMQQIHYTAEPDFETIEQTHTEALQIASKNMEKIWR